MQRSDVAPLDYTAFTQQGRLASRGETEFCPWQGIQVDCTICGHKVLQGAIAIVLGDALFIDVYADPKKIKGQVKMSILLKVAKKMGSMEIYDHLKKDPDHFAELLSKLVCFISHFSLLKDRR